MTSKERYHFLKETDPEFMEKKRAKEKLYRDTHIERYREVKNAWGRNHKEYCTKKTAKWRAENKERDKETARIWREAHREWFAKYMAEWREKHKDKIKEKILTKRKTDPGYVIRQRMASLTYQALRSKGGSKRNNSWLTLMGYSIDDLKNHIEDKFCDGMTWEALLEGRIHIDHKIPVVAFNFTSVTDVDFKRCFALSNLQPLWAIDNLKKSKKMDGPFQPMLQLNI